MQAWVPAAGVRYRWAPALGGRRVQHGPSLNVGLRNPSFRAYADYMATREFRDALADLAGRAAEQVVAIMCAESVWWRCHRRMIADALDVAGCEVLHLMDGPRLEPHRRWDALRVVDGRLTYDAPAGQAPLDL